MCVCASVFQIVGVEHITFLQKNTLNRRTRTLSIVAHNESFASRILINEHCFYSVQSVPSLFADLFLLIRAESEMSLYTAK